ncbi:MAG: hypothetical protein GY862_37080, partial [Gammaproteobacteria bacterium]|nr:hypothetical protein [Gammaproteobacteria bacterium]
FSFVNLPAIIKPDRFLFHLAEKETCRFQARFVICIRDNTPLTSELSKPANQKGVLSLAPLNRICTKNLNRAETCLINDARPKVMGFGAGKKIKKTTIGARLYPSYTC